MDTKRNLPTQQPEDHSPHVNRIINSSQDGLIIIYLIALIAIIIALSISCATIKYPYGYGESILEHIIDYIAK